MRLRRGQPLRELTREFLYCTVAFLKQYPQQGNFQTLAAAHQPRGDSSVRSMVRATISFLGDKMVEVNEAHFNHPSNHVTHFPSNVVGGVDTFPIFSLGKKHKYVPLMHPATGSFKCTNRTGCALGVRTCTPHPPKIRWADVPFALGLYGFD